MTDLVAEQWAFLLDVSILLMKAKALGYVVTGGELYRTVEQQQWYVDQGLSNTMESNHLRRLAIDLNCFKGGVVVRATDLGAFWESLNPVNRWGGNFTTIDDPDHFERNVS